MYLGLIQAVSLGLPLLTFPYLVQVLGITLFGVMALATAVMHYVNVLIDYGFNLTATRQVAQDRDDVHAVSVLYSRVQCIKFGIGLFCAFFILIIQWATDWLNGYEVLYWLVFLYALTAGLFPTWLFQGMEKMYTVFLLNVSSKLIFTLGVFMFVKEKDDYLFVPFLTLIGTFLTLMLGSFFVIRHFHLRWIWPNRQDILDQLKLSWYMFLSQLKITLFSNTNVVILGVLAGPVAVGYYAGAEKLMRALAQLQTPITQALFPQVRQMMVSDQSYAMARLRQFAVIGSCLYIVVLSVVFVLSDWLCQLLFATDGVEIAVLLRWMLPIPLCIYLNNIFGTQVMLNMGRDRAFFWVLVCVAAFSLVTCIILVTYFQGIGATLALLFTEILLTCIFAWLVKKDFF